MTNVKKKRPLLLFDIDGTLMLTAGAGANGMYAAFAHLYGYEPRRESLTFHGRTDRSILRDLLTLGGVAVTDEAIRALADRYLTVLPEHIEMNRATSVVLPGVPDLLARLEQVDSVIMALLTGNLEKGAIAKLSAFNLHTFFGFGAYGDHHEERDDVARDAWAEAERRFGDEIAREMTWVIGDTPNDIKCARAIGVKVAAVATGVNTLEELGDYKPDILLRDLSDVDGFIAAVIPAVIS